MSGNNIIIKQMLQRLSCWAK